MFVQDWRAGKRTNPKRKKRTTLNWKSPPEGWMKIYAGVSKRLSTRYASVGYVMRQAC